MITSIPLLLSIRWISTLTWIKFSSTFILFGIYYGFLITLPIGPPQLLSIRAFLLEGNLAGTVAISGLIAGQLIIFLSIYYSPLYTILIKPHILSLLSSYYIFFYWYRIKDLLNYQCLRPIISLRDLRVYNLFIDSMIFQLLNPILLPSPVLARLFNIFFFRYSNNLLFLISTLLGWFGGQYLFFHSSKILLFRIESDSPILYLLVKRVIHRIFSITILSFSPLHLGRIPVPLITKKIIDNFQLNLSGQEDSLFSQKSWPSLFFDYRQWRRPLRYIENSRFSTQSPVKKRVSQYFFNSCLSDGRPRLSFTYLPSVALFEKNFGHYLNNFEFSISSNFFKEWLETKERKREFLYNEFQYRVKSLYDGSTLTDVIEKKTGLFNYREKIFGKCYDPLLTQGHETIVLAKSPLLVTNKYDKSTKTQKHQFVLEKNNKLKDWISKRWKELEYKNFALPWEPLTRDARRILGLLIGKSKKMNFEQNSKQINFLDNDIKIESGERNNVGIGNIRKKVNRKSNLNWEFVLNLSPRQKNLYFNYLETDQWNTLKNYWKNFFLGDITRIRNFSSRIEKKNLFRDFNKEVPRWTPDLKNDKFDVIAIGVTDIRQRKVKNLGYLIKGKDKRRKIIRRFSQQSDFRRKLVKGSMRARRRKALIWKMFQLGINSPFFSRILEKPTFLITYSDEQNNSGSEQPIFRNILIKKKKKLSKQKVSVSEKTKADRLAIANRWDFPLAQWGRSWLLIIQSHVRKYLVLPLSIILKNISRLFLFQNTEWNEDWYEWNKELHIRCTYDGTEVSERELPEQWLRDGLQIKILYPFRLKPWHNSKFGNIDSDKNNQSSSNILKKQRFHYCYLTAWGFLTDLPFGNMKKQPSFWKPIAKELEGGWKKNIFHRFSMQMNKKESTMSNDIGSGKSDIKIKKIPELDSDSSRKYQKHAHSVHTLSNEGHNLVVEIPGKSEYERFIYIKNLEDLLLEKNKTQLFFNADQEKDYFLDVKIRKMELVKQLIRIKQIISLFCARNIGLMKKWFYILKINIKKIKMDSRIKIEIIKELIINLIDN
uniref:Protein TIC 214 n=1 Tax=Gymnomitrion concinnatum TaxID=209793 RepID=A0A3G6XMB9_9MARC|nr:Ycf1 [Gymnomitrion concinnatum]AZB86846.1 Ycf1 [Gymnomitrion concinnatum]